MDVVSILLYPFFFKHSLCCVFQRAEEEVQHHSRTQAGDCEGERACDHWQRQEADPRSGPGLLQELAGSCRNLPKFQMLVNSVSFIPHFNGGERVNVCVCLGWAVSGHFITMLYKIFLNACTVCKFIIAAVLSSEAVMLSCIIEDECVLYWGLSLHWYSGTVLCLALSWHLRFPGVSLKHCDEFPRVFFFFRCPTLCCQFAKHIRNPFSDCENLMRPHQ